MKIKFEIQLDNYYLWRCITNRNFKKLKSALFRIDKPDRHWNGYFIFIYPIAIYIIPKDKLSKQNYNWIMSIINDPNRLPNMKLKKALEEHKEFKKAIGYFKNI